MKCTITFRNLEHTKALDQKIREKSNRLKEYLATDSTIDWSCWIEKNSQIGEARIKSKSTDFVAKAESDSLYKTMDLVIDKIENQISHKH